MVLAPALPGRPHHQKVRPELKAAKRQERTALIHPKPHSHRRHHQLRLQLESGMKQRPVNSFLRLLRTRDWKAWMPMACPTWTNSSSLPRTHLEEIRLLVHEPTLTLRCHHTLDRF